MYTSNTILTIFLLTGYTNAFTPSSLLSGPASHVPQNVAPLASATIMEDQFIPTDEDEDTQSKTYLDDGFVFGLEGSGLERQRGKVSQVFVEGDSLETKPWQLATVSTTFLTQAVIAATAVSQLYAKTGGDVLSTGVGSALTVALSWILADMGSGILHWR